MPWNTKSAARCSRKQPFACGALAALTCIALASCGAGPGAARPDLVVESPEVSADRPAAGASFTFTATVRNAGRGSAAATTLRVYRSHDAAITPAGEPVGAAAVAELAASASHAATVTVTAPSSPGVSYYRACADPVAGESDTANNCSATVRVVVQVRDTAPRPDLVVESPAVSDGSPVAGASVTFTAAVRNAGDGEAAATTMVVYRSEDDTVTPSDEQVGDVAVPELAALERSPASVELTAPASSGTRYYGACVHAVAEESDTANNCSAPVPVTVQAPQVPASGPPGPDLVVKRFWVNTASPAIGGVFGLRADVRNRGAMSPFFTTLRFYRSTDAAVTRSDTEVATGSVPPLRIDSDKYDGYVFATVKAPSSKGTYYYGACVDGVAGESATTNNCSAAVKVEVSRNSPDLGVAAWSVSERAIGESLSVGLIVSNTGSPSEATTLRILLLPDKTSKPSAGTQVGEVDVPELVVTDNSPAHSLRYVEFEAPATAGRYYYVGCVDAVPRESDTANNCSTVTRIGFR